MQRGVYGELRKHRACRVGAEVLHNLRHGGRSFCELFFGQILAVGAVVGYGVVPVAQGLGYLQDLRGVVAELAGGIGLQFYEVEGKRRLLGDLLATDCDGLNGAAGAAWLAFVRSGKLPCDLLRIVLVGDTPVFQVGVVLCGLKGRAYPVAVYIQIGVYHVVTELGVAFYGHVAVYDKPQGGSLDAAHRKHSYMRVYEGEIAAEIIS